MNGGVVLPGPSSTVENTFTRPPYFAPIPLVWAVDLGDGPEPLKRIEEAEARGLVRINFAGWHAEVRRDVPCRYCGEGDEH